jgi:hypothetical protein
LERRSLWKNLVKKRVALIGHLTRHGGILRNNRGKELQGKAKTCKHKASYEGCRLHNVCGNESKANGRSEWRDAANQSWD